MELTQRLECTQELYPNSSEKDFPDQIGFLGICGTKYPLKKGPNKIGRDPDTCNIHLNLNSISRQHAVINILSNHEYMLMDLDSANKTKLCDKTLQAYIPYPLKNGDMVQFGQAFGVFRLFEEDNNLPMTQAIDVPETPVHRRHVSKLNTIHVTTIPESPDVSDRDDSFIGASQQKPTNIFKSPNNRFIKTSGPTVSIKPVGTNKIDNIFWSSSRKSDSFSSQSNISNNDSAVPVDNKSDQTNIHEVDTQITVNNDDTNDSIYNANTQCTDIRTSPSIHYMETQVPTDLPEVCKIPDQHNLHFNFTTDNKENDINIHDAETQVEPKENKNFVNNIVPDPLSTESKDNVSDEVILFDEIDSQPLQDNFESQALLPPEFDDLNKDIPDVPIETIKESKIISGQKKCTNRVLRVKSDSSTDCEDEDIHIAMTQKIPEINDDDITDCEDEPVAIAKSTEQIKDNINAIDDDVTDCEDNFDNDNLSKPKQQIHDLDTQIIENDTKTEQSNILKDNYKKTPNDVIEVEENVSKEEETNVPFEDLLTQIIIDDEPQKNICFEEELTQNIYSQEIVPPFKIPKPSHFKDKRKDISDLNIDNLIENNEHRNSNENVDVDDKLYYAATQDIFNDLCTQRELSPTINKIPSEEPNVGKNDEVNELPAAKTVASKPCHESTDDSDIDDKIDSFVSSLSNSQISDVIGVKNVSSGSSVAKQLPATDKIKNNRKSDVLSESAPGGDMRPHIKKDTKKEASKTKTNNKKIEDEMIPTRKITRIRKPTVKMLNNDETAKNLGDNVLMATLSTKNKETKSDNIKNVKEKSNKSKTKSEPDERNNTKDNKTKTYDKTKGESKKSDNETRGRKRAKDKEEQKSEPAKPTVAQSNNKKILNDISHYLDNTERHTRSRSNQKSETINDKSEKKEKAHSREQSTDKKSQHTRTKEIERSKSPLENVRRSKRHRSSKKKEEIRNDLSKANLTNGALEKSAVYNISYESLNKVKFKRSATENIELPSAKKTKTETNSNNLSLRATPARKVKTHYVLFTAFPCEKVKVKLEKLGAKIVTDVMQCTVVLTMQIKRTFKLLCALGLGKPIVGPSWVQVCADSNMIVDPWQHLIKDETTEKRFQFNLERSLSVPRGFLKGYNISSTPSVMPCAQEMQLIVECSGGTWKSKGPKWICVSAIADKVLWPALKRKGATIVSTEFILAGVLRQKVEIDVNKLEDVL